MLGYKVNDERDNADSTEKEDITKEITDEDIKTRFKDIEKIILPFLYNLSKKVMNLIYIGQMGSDY